PFCSLHPISLLCSPSFSRWTMLILTQPAASAFFGLPAAPPEAATPGAKHLGLSWQLADSAGFRPSTAAFVPIVLAQATPEHHRAGAIGPPLWASRGGPGVFLSCPRFLFLRFRFRSLFFAPLLKRATPPRRRFRPSRF